MEIIAKCQLSAARKRGAAIHEAGHVVAHLEIGRPFKCVEFLPIDEMVAGRVVGCRVEGRVVGSRLTKYALVPPEDVASLDSAAFKAYRRLVFEELVVSYAGPAAEARQRHLALQDVLNQGVPVCRSDMESEEPSDFVDIANLKWSIGRVEGEGRVLEDEAVWIVRQLFRRPAVWDATKCIADALQERCYLSYRNVLLVANDKLADCEFPWSVLAPPASPSR